MIPAPRGGLPSYVPLPSMADEFGHWPKTSPQACCNHSAAELLAVGGAGARPVADDDADAAELVAARSGGARPVADDDTDAAELFAAGGGVARLVADDNAEGPVAGGTRGNAGNAAKDSQTGQPPPPEGQIAGSTRSRMVA